MLAFLEQYDYAAKYAFEHMHGPRLNRIMAAVAHFGDRRVLIAVAIASAVVAFLLDQRRTAGLLVAPWCWRWPRTRG